jgi:hypothetical protein
MNGRRNIRKRETENTRRQKGKGKRQAEKIPQKKDTNK